MIHSDVTIIDQKKISKDYFEMEFSLPNSCAAPQPGQFFTLSASKSSQPLLRRPFAFSSATSGSASLIYQKRGEGTTLMTQWKSGDKVNFLGPLGTSFPEPDMKSYPILLAGGIGTGPILFFSEKLSTMKIPHTLIFGCRTKEMVPKISIPENADFQICTDDGSKGFKGNVIEKLRQMKIEQKQTLYGCGPLPMLKEAHNYTLKMENTLYVSLEEMMGCAVGACMGCVVETSDDRKYVRVCKEGPVFNSKEILWK